MAAIFFDGAEPFEQVGNTLLWNLVKMSESTVMLYWMYSFYWIALSEVILSSTHNMQVYDKIRKNP